MWNRLRFALTESYPYEVISLEGHRERFSFQYRFLTFVHSSSRHIQIYLVIPRQQIGLLTESRW